MQSAPPAPLPASPPGTYRCGSLTYTKRHLAVLFFWLLWGDFCYVLMEAVVPSIMPLKFKELDASNFAMGMILGTIPGIIDAVLNPIISFKSDRFRSRWGRRIPFILFTIPMLVLSLVGVAFADRLGLWFHHAFGASLQQFSANQVVLIAFGAFLVIFTFFNAFVGSVFWYLFNDVVPDVLLARFMSWFRIISMGAGALYNFFVFPYAGTHSTEILLGAALLYLVGFVLMCIYVKEGEYPPAPPYLGGKTGPFAAITTFGKECHALPHYWYQWLASFIGSISAGAATFGLLFSLAIGLDLKQIGLINGTSSIVGGILILGSGWLADRYHPIRVVMLGFVLQLLIVTPASLIWLFWLPSPEVAFWVAMILAVGLAAPVGALTGIWDPPLLMRLFPRSRYGQFCATNAVWRGIGGIIGGSLAGLFLDAMAQWVGKERAYFFIPVWQLAFGVPRLYLLHKLYQSWQRYGGDAAYVAPITSTEVDNEAPVAGNPS